MANTVVKGPYGMYYPYKDENGKRHGLKILNDVYTDYYEPGYLTDDHLEAMLAGKTISFNTANTTISAKLVEYINKNGHKSKIIQFDVPNSESDFDKDIIISHSGDLIKEYYDTGRFDYRKPQELINGLDLANTWTTYATYKHYLGKTIFLITIDVYRRRVPRAKFSIYGIVDLNNNNCISIDKELYDDLTEMYNKKDQEYLEELADKRNEAYNVRLNMLRWINDIVAKIWPNGSKQSYTQIAETIEDITKDVNVDNMSDRIIGLNGSITSGKSRVNRIFDAAEYRVRNEIDENTYKNETLIQSIKDGLLQNLKVYASYVKLKLVRDELYKQYSTSGLDAMTASIDIDSALSLGYFPMVQKALVKYKNDAPKYIIYDMYKEVVDVDELKNKLLNLLKIFYDFYDFPEKDRQAVAKYIAKHKLSDYYKAVSVFDDVLEILIDNSRDPRLTKPLLESIAGTPRANVLKDKTFYFEKRGYLRNEILLYKPIELVEELRKYIKEFNVSSNVAILTNIELDEDESFIFQFYTFAEAEGDEKGFDGRRMLNLTRIYNRHHPKDKIGFNFNNESIESEDE